MAGNASQQVSFEGNVHHMVTHSKVAIFKPKIFHTIPVEPSSIKEAKASTLWFDAMLRELDALHMPEAWVLILHKPFQKVIDSK